MHLKIILFSLGIGIYNHAFAQDFIYHTSTDLNGDNQNENISIQTGEGSPEFFLEIADHQVSGRFISEGADGFQIIDINNEDQYKEVAVHTSGASDDDEYRIFGYDGTSIKEMGYLSRWPTFLGNGIVYVDGWEGFWMRKDKYVLDNTTRTLNLVPQYAYYVGVKVMVIKSYPIFKDKDLQQQVAILSENSEIELLLCDAENRTWNEYLYLIKSKSGLIGWARFEDIFKNSEGFPMAD